MLLRAGCRVHRIAPDVVGKLLYTYDAGYHRAAVDADSDFKHPLPFLALGDGHVGVADGLNFF